MAPTVDVRVSPAAAGAIDAAAAHIAEALTAAVAQRGHAHLALSGGGGERARAGGAVQVGVAPQGSAKVPSGTGP